MKNATGDLNVFCDFFGLLKEYLAWLIVLYLE